MKKMPLYVIYLFFIWAVFLIVAIMLTFNSGTIEKCRYYEEKVSAATLTKSAQNVIKEYKLNNGIEISAKDINNTGMIGTSYSYITTTLGIIESKRTSTNPDFAAVIIDMFKDVGVKKGDQICAIFSGSFPALNIAVLSAIEVFNLDACIMVSIGASSYGANDPNFTFYDMAILLHQKKVFSNSIDYVSLGGSHDVGSEFTSEVVENLKTRINSNGTKFIYEEDYVKNIDYRMKVIENEVPNMKLLINVGGNLVSMGKDEESFSSSGLIFPSQTKLEVKSLNEKNGLIDRYLQRGIPVAHLLNLKGIALSYGVPYDPVGFDKIGTISVYYDTNYSLIFPLVSLGLSLIILGYLLYLCKKGVYK